MSKLYGTLVGSRGEATRCGTRNSGIKASVQSYNGSLISRMWYTDDDQLMVSLDIAEGSSNFYGDTIFHGTLDELKNKLQRN